MKIIITFLSLLGIVFNTQAQNNERLIRYYDSSAVTISLGTFSGMRLSHQGESCSSMFGVSQSMKKTLCQYESSKEHYLSYRSKNTTAIVFMLGGLAMTTVGYFRGSSSAYSPRRNNNAAYLVLGGAISTLIGAFVLQSGYSELLQSVNEHNREAIKNYRE